MNKFSLNQQSSTVGSVVIMSGLLACQLVPDEISKINLSGRFEKESYDLDDSSPTFSEYGGLNKNFFEHGSVSNDFEQFVGEFYSKFLANQEPLGEEFEEVLFNNLWDLYED